MIKKNNRLKKKKEFEVNNFDAFIMIRTGFNDYESMDVPKEMTRIIESSKEKIRQSKNLSYM